VKIDPIVKNMRAIMYVNANALEDFFEKVVFFSTKEV